MTKITLLQDRIAALEAEVERLGFDEVTGCANRGSLNVALQTAFEAAKRRSQRMAVLMVDVDDFKIVNDRRGHPFGDETLRCVANVLRATVRASDTVGRYGGDEFCVVLRDFSDKHEVRVLANRICKGVRISSCAATISIGGALFNREFSLRDLVFAADAALLYAKRDGKNKVLIG